MKRRQFFLIAAAFLASRLPMFARAPRIITKVTGIDHSLFISRHTDFVTEIIPARSLRRMSDGIRIVELLDGSERTFQPDEFIQVLPDVVA